MSEIVTALLTGQRKVIVSGIEINLPTLKPDTLKMKERQAQREAEKIMKILKS